MAVILHGTRARSFEHLKRSRTDLIREIGVFCVAYHGNIVKLMQEIGLRWPDATAGEVDAAMGAAAGFVQGDEHG